MASTSDSELDYLSPSFDPSSLTVPRLRSVLVSHDISYPASAKKSQLIDIFTSELVPKSRKILAARARARRTSKGITDMPSSQGSTVDGDEDEIAKIMAPPPVPESSRRKSRKSRASTEDGPGELSSKSRVLGNGRASTKHARTSDSDATPEVETKRPLARKTRKSETTPDVRTEEPDQPIVRPPLRESAFSDENPFQSGSSPPPPSEDRRKSANRSGDRRKTSSRRTTQRTASPGPSVKKEDGVAVPSSKTFEMSVAALKKPKIKQEPDDSVETGEEFTPEEQLELVRSRAANGERDIFGPRRKRASRRSSGVSRSAPWVVIMTIMIGFATWWRREKLEIGYCGVGRPSTALENVQLPEWITGLQPECEPCPQHAYCYSGMEARCEPNFVRKPHPLSLGGLIPLPPSCEPDGDKVRKIKSVADRAVEELRERRAKWECGDLVNEQGKDVQTVGIDAADLKTEVGKKRRRGMSEEEFEDLWKGALGEIIGRDEVTSETDGLTHHLITSNSLARLPLSCALRRSARLTLARHRLSLGAVVLFVSIFAYLRTYVLSLRASRARVPALVAMTLDRLATQAVLHSQGKADESWISAGQLRDDVLRNEFSAKRRDEIWKRVKAVVEENANVRASVRETRAGDISRVWEWIGSLGAIEDGDRGGRRSLGSPVTNEKPSPGDDSKDWVEVRRWDEGRPIY